MSFWETFKQNFSLATFIAVFIAQMMALSIAWLFKRFIEPRLDWAHKKVRKIRKKVTKW